MQSFFSSATAAATAALTTPISITLTLAEGKQGHTQWSPPPGSSSTTPVKASVFSNGERISGEIKLLVNGGKRVDHAGVRVEVKGILDASTEKAPHEFLSLVCEVTGPGTLAGLSSHPFSFPAPDLPVESYVGVNARVRYVVRATVSTKGSFAAAGGQRGEVEFVVRNPHALPPPPGGSGPGGGGIPAAALTDPDAPILLEVGIEDCLHIEFQYSRMRYHLADTVTGHIDFKQLGIKLRKMEVAVVRKENVGTRECAGQGTAPARVPMSHPSVPSPSRTPFNPCSWVAAVHV